MSAQVTNDDIFPFHLAVKLHQTNDRAQTHLDYISF